MKHITLLTTLLLTGFMTVSAQEVTRIGVVDADMVIQQSAKGKAFFEEYQKFNQDKQNELKVLFDEINAKKKDAQAKAASLSEEKARDLAMEIQRLDTDFKRRREDYNRESENMLSSKLETFKKDLVPLIRQVAEEKQLDVVLNYGPNTNIVYFSAKVNITDAVIKKYDEQAGN